MRIFISSTFKDLRPERHAAITVLRESQLVPWGMELFSSEPSKPLDVALRELALSDAVVLIVGFKAGSLIPESRELTYTAAEFLRARELGRPVFAFIQTESGVHVNKETVEVLRDALDKFKRDVEGGAITPAYFENSDQLQTAILLAIQKWDAKGRPGARLTFTTAEEFFAPYRVAREGRLFDFDQTLRGRAAEIENLNNFLADPNALISILVGRGGIGKSKLLHDWSASVLDASIVYVRDDADWHPEAAKEIPVGRVVIVADDAHRLSFLDNLLTLLRNLKLRQDIKLVLGTRPSGSVKIDAALAIRFDPRQVTRFPVLERIANQDVFQLAQEVQGADRAGYAHALAAVSADTPLVTVVGGRLIVRGDIAPGLLANEMEFRHQVFDRFSAEYERLLPAGNVNWRALLNLIAALSPLAPDSKTFLGPAEQILHLRPDEIAAAVTVLERNGLLLRSGSVVRIVPDLLSDFILEGACLTLGAEPTGFADMVFHNFHPAFLSSLIVNLGELDWRLMHAGRNAPLLDGIWTDITNSFDRADAAGRVEILGSLRGVALFQPIPVWDLIRRAIGTEALATTLLPEWRITQEDVLRKVPSLLKPIAYHLDHFQDAVRTLWQLANRDRRAPNQYPEHAWRVLEDLAEYERNKPVDFNDRMVEFARELAPREGAFDGPHTPLDLVDKLLAKEGHFTEADGMQVRFGGFALRYPVIQPVRQKALSLIEACLNSDNAKIASRAISSISHILSGFLPLIGRQQSPEDYAWQNAEREVALDFVEGRLRRQPLPVTMIRLIRSMLFQCQPHTPNAPTAERIGRILASIPQTDDLVIFDAFCTGLWDHDGRYPTIEEATLAHQELVNHGVDGLRRISPTVQEQVNAITLMVAEAHSANIDLAGKPDAFIGQMCLDRQFLDEFLNYLFGAPIPVLAHMVDIPLRALRTDDAGAYSVVGNRAASHENVFIAHGAANAVCFGPGLLAPLPADLQILQSLSRHPNAQVRRTTLIGIGRIGAHAPFERNAIDLIVQTDIGDHSLLAEEMCSALDTGRIRVSNLTETDVSNVLRKLVQTNKVDGYHTTRFLEWAGQTHPAALCEFIILRVDRSSSMRARGESTGYVPVPHPRLGGAFHTLQGSPRYKDILEQVRDRFVSQLEERLWLGELFWAIGTLDAVTLGALDERLHADDVAGARAILDLLSGAPEELVLRRPYFAVHTIEKCHAISHDLADRARSRLISNALMGFTKREVGQPSPKYLNLRERAASLASIFTVGSLGREFFTSLRNNAENELKRERINDEEIQFE